MKQFARVQQGSSVVPVLVSDNERLDLRSLVADITPESIGSGVLHEFDIATLKPVIGEVQYLAPIHGVRQIPRRALTTRDTSKNSRFLLRPSPRSFSNRSFR
jgi:hypothetical protein